MLPITETKDPTFQMNAQSAKAPYPSFIIGGAAKSGTTSLSRYLTQQPGIFIPDQEPNFFTYINQKTGYRVKNQPFIRSLETYFQFMEPPGTSDNDVVIGEKSVSYLYKGYYKQVIENIRQYHPSWKSIKWIFILRHPVERAYSQYIHNQNFHETRPFLHAIKQWPKREAAGWIPAYDYLGAGYYSHSLQAYLDNFQHIRVYLFEDLAQRPEWLLKDIIQFLEMDDHIMKISFKKYNPSGMPKNKFFEFVYGLLGQHSFLKSIIGKTLSPNVRDRLKKYTHQKPPLSETVKKELSADFRKDIKQLEGLIGRDLTGWYDEE